jgi:hypothetical protein
MKKFDVTLPIITLVTINIEADDAETAKKEAINAFDIDYFLQVMENEEVLLDVVQRVQGHVFDTENTDETDVIPLVSVDYQIAVIELK